eukprot:m.36140 g.36140  ORF g.36140 m.36140 type:complete len:404 (+) comp12451_c0_seq1:1-1212(+)
MAQGIDLEAGIAAARKKGGGRMSRLQKLLASGAYEKHANPGRPLFTFRSNVFYFGHMDTEVPSQANSISFRPHDFIQVVEVVDSNWWIGSVVGQGDQCGYVPSDTHWLTRYRGETGGISRKSTWRASVSRESQMLDQSAGDLERLLQDKGVQLDHIFNRTGERVDTPPHRVTFAPSSVTFSGSRAIRPYKLAPDIRPAVLLGPSRAGSKVTDSLQRALVGYLCLSFPQAIEVVEVPPTAVRMTRGSRSASDDTDVFDDVIIQHVYQSAREGKLCVLHCDVDDTAALKESTLTPMLIFLRMPNAQVLTKLIRGLGDREETKTTTQQVNALEKFNALPNQTWNLVLPRSKLDVSCYEIGAYIDAYYNEATLPLVVDPELDTGRQLLTPGTITETMMFHPGADTSQ